jgi:hypothetical protein
MALLDPNEIMFTAFQPKVANRFFMYIDGIPSYIIKKVTSPHFTDAEIKIDHINTYFYVAGKREWQDMTMELYSPITPSGEQAVMEWARLCYESVTGRAGYSDFYKKDITLDIVGPVGDIVGEWKIVGSWVKDAAFGELDWSAGDQALMIPITLKMDYCVLNF